MKPNAQCFSLQATHDGRGPSEVLMWDGRLDNREDLRGSLRDALGSDTTNAAVALAAFERWGIEGLGRLIGDWSLIIHDRRHQAVVLACDFAGVRPLYYHQHEGVICWSARLEALVDATHVDTLDEEYMAGFLTVDGCPNRTPYAGIPSVPPGHAVSVTAAGATTRSFWSLPTGDLIRYRDERRYDEELRALFREAVAVRLQTDAPVVAELSGGLDSSSVVCMASQLIRSGAVPAPQLTTVSYVQRDSSDARFAHEVERFCGIHGAQISIDRDPLVTAAAVGDAMPQPWAPVHRSAAAVARRLGAKVFLTGQNGDLTMGNWYDDSLQVVGSLRRGHLVRGWHEALAWSKLLRVPIGWILWRACRTLSAGSASSDLYSLDGASTPRSLETSLNPDFLKRSGAANQRSVFSTEWLQAPPERRKHFRALTLMRELRTLQLPEALQGLDYTHPFAHRPLVEFVMSVPPDVLCRPGEPRRLMRRALADLWPAKLRSRRSKSLFAAPWIEALRPLAMNLLGMPEWHVVDRGWVDRASLTSRLKRLTYGLDCNEPQLRQILLLEYWLRNRHQDQPGEVRQTA